MIDAQPGDGWVVPAAVATRAGRSTSAAADAALAASSRCGTGRPVPAATDPWLRAARPGRPTRPQPGQQAVLRGGRRGAGPAGRERPIRRAVADFAERYVLQDRCPADDQLEEQHAPMTGSPQPDRPAADAGRPTRSGS